MQLASNFRQLRSMWLVTRAMLHHIERNRSNVRTKKKGRGGGSGKACVGERGEDDLDGGNDPSEVARGGAAEQVRVSEGKGGDRQDILEYHATMPSK